MYETNLIPFLQLGYQEKVAVSRQICQGVMFMHSANPPVAHLDLKPESVLVLSIHSYVLFFRHLKLSPVFIMQVEDHTLQIFIADFGLSRVMTMTYVWHCN